jgi:hypothetical protein
MHQVYVEVAEQWFERAVRFRHKCRLRFGHARLMMWLALFRAAERDR